ncbi:MAG: ATP-binding protein [Chlorobi bacterium]|nr:MAG: ATP-binding protein [Bacteroidota bacterium]KXK34657.1 MAG: Divergent AAA domain protein [Chlorobi bacterium OLB6]MBL1160960.1 ATP-binding protein [Chlorobiota bacterium]MBW7852918.1 ATP-binding protein [Candidatus Kapabacteria bacterium]MCC6330851.1 ATP-binding protein [Ignavibacteria bacterium]
MWPKPLTDVTSEDIQALIQDRAPESRHLEFKRQPPNSSDTEMTRFLLTVAAFANAGGGYLVYGINAEADGADQGGTASEVVPIAENIDALIRRLEGSMLTRIHPRVYAGLRGVPAHEVFSSSDDGTGNGDGTGSGKGSGPGRSNADGTGFGVGVDEPVGHVLVVRIPPSTQTPHAVQTNDGFKFPVRVSAGRQNMDMHEIRRAIVNSESAVDRIRKFTQERYEMLRPTFVDGTTVLHLLPMNPELGSDIISSFSEDGLQKFTPLWMTGGWHTRYNLDGYLNASYIDGNEDGSSYSSTQVFRDGRIEAVTHHWGLDNLLRHERLVEQILRAVPRYMEMIESKVNPYPLVVSLSLNLHPETVLSTEVRRPKKVRQNDLHIPHIVLQQKPESWPKAFRPIFDLLWNAFGLDRCWYYDEAGNFDLRNGRR